MATDSPRFVVAKPIRDVCDDHARILESHGRLRFLGLGTRRGASGIPSDRTRLFPAIGLASYLFAKVFSTTRAESLRFALHPLFDAWLERQLRPGDILLSTYGCANRSFRWARRHGGKTLLSAGNSHPVSFYAILEEEHRRWNCPEPPIARHHYRRSLAMMDEVDFVLSPSQFVTRSFLENGFSSDRIWPDLYPLDLALFTPARDPRPAERPLTIISTGTLSLRKGTPYLLEAFRLVRRQIPNARLLLTRLIMDNARPILARYADLPIEWSPPLPHAQLAERLRGADLFVLPSLEEGSARTVTEALACGLPAIVTFNTGSSDFVRPGESGEIVPIRDPAALAEAILRWWEKIRLQVAPPRAFVSARDLSPDALEAIFLPQLAQAGL